MEKPDVRRSQHLLPPPGLAARGPKHWPVRGKHSFFMYMSDLLATGQPSKVKGV